MTAQTDRTRRSFATDEAVAILSRTPAWVAHDLDHVMQISRVLARQYSDEVGPWELSGHPAVIPD